MKISPSTATAIKTLFATYTILKEHGGSLPGRDVLAEIDKRVEFTDWEQSRYEKTGNIRWRSILHFYSIDSIKAGHLIKKKGIWYLTPEGEKAMSLGPEGLFEVSKKAYKDWRLQNPKTTEAPIEENESVPPPAMEANPAASVDDVQSEALKGIEEYISGKNAYEFQDLCAALLRGMGYFTPFVAPKGRDGGIDIMAYRDPLGTVAPRMKVQVKHRESAANAPEVHQLLGILRGDGDVGIFISSGGYTADAKAAARNSRVHIELIDLERFIELWQQFYPKLTDEDKSLLPLLPVYFLAPSE